jgi:hypothetical protein
MEYVGGVGFVMGDVIETTSGELPMDIPEGRDPSLKYLLMSGNSTALI